MYEEVEERDYLLKIQKDNGFVEDDDGSGYVDHGQKEDVHFYDSDNDNNKISNGKFSF